MRTTTLFALFALLCLLSIAFATESTEKVVPKATAAVDATHVKALQDKIAKLDSDLTAMRTTIGTVQQENKDLIKRVQQAEEKAAKAIASQKSAPTAAKEDPKFAELSSTVAALRTKVEALANQVANSGVVAQVTEGLQTAQKFYTQQVHPKVEQGVAVAGIYAAKAQLAVAPYMGKTQGILSRVYHQVRALVTQYKPIAVAKIAAVVAGIKQIPADKRPMVVDIVLTVGLFFALFFVFITVYGIWRFFVNLLSCGGSRKKQSKQQPQQPAAQKVKK
jgi:outer membrane murein-binding lipoprotein Lpp